MVMMNKYRTVGEIAREWRVNGWDVHPQRLANLLYQSGTLRDQTVVSGGRRLIPSDLIPAIEVEARRAGLLPPLQSA